MEHLNIKELHDWMEETGIVYSSQNGYRFVVTLAGNYIVRQKIGNRWRDLHTGLNAHKALTFFNSKGRNKKHEG